MSSSMEVCQETNAKYWMDTCIYIHIYPNTQQNFIIFGNLTFSCFRGASVKRRRSDRLRASRVLEKGREENTSTGHIEAYTTSKSHGGFSLYSLKITKSGKSNTTRKSERTDISISFYVTHFRSPIFLYTALRVFHSQGSFFSVLLYRSDFYSPFIKLKPNITSLGMYSTSAPARAEGAHPVND